MKKATILFGSNTNKNQYYRLLGFIFFILWTIGLPFTARATLRINSVTPDHGGRNENTLLTINGEGFSSEDRVAIWGGGTYIKGSHSTKGRANALDCSGSYAYLACGKKGDPNSQGVQIFDIQDPNIPQPVHFFPLPEVANDIDVVGNYAYVAASGAGLYILDVQDPVTPSLVSSLLLPGKAKKLCVYSIYLFIAADYEGLHIIDISNLTAPEIKGSCPLPEGERAFDVIAEENYAYLAAGDAGLKIIDISDPSNPILSESFDENSGSVCSVYKRGKYLYLSESNKGVEIVSDLSDPNIPIPQLVSKITTQDAYQVFIEGNFLYVADGYGGIKICDHNDNNPQGWPIIGFQKKFGIVKDLRVFNDNIFIADEDEGLIILDAKNPRNPSIASIVILDQSSENVAGLHLQDDEDYPYLYVFSKEASNWLKILDVSDPQNPLVLGTTDIIGSNPEDLTAKDDIAYLVGNDGLEVFKVNDITNHPTRIKSFADYYNARGIYLKEDMLFFACAENNYNPATTLNVLSLEDPKDPAFENYIDMDPNYSTEAISGTGDYLMLAKGRGGMEIFTIQDPSQPSRVCGITFANSDIKDIHVSGGYAYLADATGKGMAGLLRTVNITDPSNPDLRSSYITKEKPLSLTLSDRYLYLAEEESAEIEIFDVGQPEDPQVVALLPTLTLAVEIVSDGADYVYLAMKTGIMALRALKPCPGDPICVNATTLTVSTPIGLAAGTYNISVAGPDGSLAVLPNGFTIEGNRPPVFIEPIFNPPLVYLFEGEEYSFSIIASDPDGDSLNYSASLSMLPGASLDGNVFSWTPIIGQYQNVIFTVYDDEFTVEQKITIIVEEDPDPNTVANSSPELFVPSSPQAGEEGIAMSFLVQASDPEPEDLTTLEISMLNAPPGAELRPLGIQEDKMAACFLWTPTYQQAGDYTITFIAKDQHSSEDQQIVSINIQDVSSSPQVNLLTGTNFWLCPAGRSNYFSFDFLKEHGEEAIYSLHAYDWDLSLLYSSYWFFGKPSGGNFSMDKSLLYVIYTKEEILFNWPLNL